MRRSHPPRPPLSIFYIPFLFRLPLRAAVRFEIAGMVLFVTALLRHLAETVPVLRVEFSS